MILICCGIYKERSKAIRSVHLVIQVPAEADDAQMAEFHRQLQGALERVTRFAEEHVARVGSAECPIIKS